MSTYTFYFAGELFSQKHLIGNAMLAKAIYEESKGKYLPILPQDLEFRDTSPKAIRDEDLVSLIQSDLALFHFDGRPLPRRVRGLAIGPSTVEGVRLDAHTLELTVNDGWNEQAVPTQLEAPSDPIPATIRPVNSHVYWVDRGPRDPVVQVDWDASRVTSRGTVSSVPRPAGQIQIPWEVDPGILADLGYERVDHRPARRLRVDRR